MSREISKTLEICTVAACKCLCNYCGQKDLIAAYTRETGQKINFKTNLPKMSWETFTTCVNKLPIDVVLDFAGLVEPFHSDLTSDFILYGHNKGYRIRLYSTGDNLTKDAIDKIVHVPFMVTVIHMPDALGILKVDVTDEYVSTLEYLIDKIKCLAHCFGPLHPKLNHLRNKLFIEDKKLTSEHLINRGGHVETSKLVQLDAKSRKTGKLWCKPVFQHNNGPFGKFQFNILYSTGAVLLCCCCYGLDHILGNLTDPNTTYESLFESDEYKRVMKGVEDESENILCRTCDLAVPWDWKG